MSRLVTQLVADDPAIVLVGENTILRDKLGKSLARKNVQISYIDPNKIEENLSLLEKSYKVVWVADTFNEYLAKITSLKKISTPLLVVVPVFQPINNHSSDLLTVWMSDSIKQLQFITDCNYHLSSATFIFGLDLMGNNNDISSIKYVLNNVRKKVVVDPSLDFNFLSIDDFVSKATDLIFVPRSQSSTLIKGKKIASTRFIALVKKLYDAYHNTSLEVIRDSVSLEKVIPFFVTEKTVSTDTRSIATYLVKKLPAPVSEEKITKREVIPTPLVPDKKEHSSQNTPQLFHPTAPELVQHKEMDKIPEETKKEVLVNSSEQNDQQLEKKHNLSKENVNETDFNKEIQRIFKTTRTDKKVERVEKIVKSTKKIKKKSKRKTTLFYGGLLSVGMAIGMLVLAASYFISGSILKNQIISTLGKTAQAEELFAIEQSSALERTVSFVTAQTDIYGKIIELDIIAKNSVLVKLGTQFLEMPSILLEADKASKNLVLQILKGNVSETSELAEILTQTASNAYESLSLMQATLEQADLGEYSAEQESVIEKFETEIKDYRSSLAIQQQLQQILPDFVGVNEKRTYALLLQNNQELRPTGGFIQAVALANFDNGSLVSYKVYSVYELDQKLPGKVVPPQEIERYLGEKNWFLRDSNWDPDFPSTSKQVAWFIKKSLNVDLDGVIALNIYGLSDILSAIGPIELPEYNEVITDRNIEERMEFHSEVVLVDSPDSVDYSVKILNEILNKLVVIEENSVPTLLTSLNNTLKTKQTQISSFTESEQSIFNSLGWSGGLSIPSCPARLSIVDCTVSSMAQVEANIGINKANYYLDRAIVHRINLSRSEAQHSRTIIYKNNAKSNSWPKGTYKSYQRFFVNKDASVSKVLINGSQLSEEQITQEIQGDFKVIGIRVDVPIQKQVAVDLVYSTPLAATDSFSYVFYNKKQSGLDNDLFSVTVSHSPEMKPVLVAPSATISDNTITFDALTLDDASLFGVQFE